jgi:hypothetical protein
MRLLIALVCGGVLLLTHAPIFADVPIERDDDGDGFSNAMETHIGTSPLARCMPYANDGLIDANPADFNQDNLFDIFDVIRVTRWFGTDINGIPYLYRYDLSSEPQGDGVIDIFDISKVTALFGTQC